MAPSTDHTAAIGSLPETFTGDVLAWGVPQLRDLPWRRTRDPWRVLVSEVMLQQTQALRVVPRWERFLDRFPTVEACAAAPLADVLREWQGLGYPRRARNLHLAAQRVVELGGFPRDLERLLTLPGVGSYTARALMTFAFELDAAVVDTNIARVYARVCGRGHTTSVVQRLADSAVPSGSAWAWNQCLMDLGAVLCRPREPRCDSCPLQSYCGWHTYGGVDPAIGSSGVSVRQPRFEGSDRQARGRLMKSLTSGRLTRSNVAGVMQRDSAAAERLLDDLVGDGLCVIDGEWVQLP